MNDDGEPSGSAGRPIFGQFLSGDLSDILVVVIRYFGGTLLGVSGLIRAYRSATTDALEQAEIVERKVEQQLELHFPYADINAVMRLVKEYKPHILKQHFDMECTLKLSIWTRPLPSLTAKLSKIENCRIKQEEE